MTLHEINPFDDGEQPVLLFSEELCHLALMKCVMPNVTILTGPGD